MTQHTIASVSVIQDYEAKVLQIGQDSVAWGTAVGVALTSLMLFAALISYILSTFNQ